MLTEIIIDLFNFLPSILDWDIEMDSVGDWERETPGIDKFFTYSLNNLLNFSNTFSIFSS